MANSALELCSRLLFSLVLIHGTILKSDSAHGQEISLLPEDICPCIVREECPRVFGSRPEDELLGSFSPCEDPVAVRCCGVATRISVSSNDPNYGIGDSGDEKTAVPIIPPGINVPVSFKFPEYVVHRNSATKGGEKSMGNYKDRVSYKNRDIDEAISYVKKDSEDPEYFDQGESNSAKSLRGEIPEDNVSRIDASMPSDHLDYSRVNKYGVRGGGSRFQTITGSRVYQRGVISTSKKAENTSSSSSSSSSSTSEIKTESIVNNEEVSSEKASSDVETLPRSQEEVTDSEEVDLPTERIVPVFKQSTPQLFFDERFNKLKSGSMRSKGFENHQETSSQHKSEVSEKEESNFEDSSSASLSIENEHREHRKDLERLKATTADQELEVPIHSRDAIGHEDENQGSDQHRTESIANELNKVEENISSNSESVSLISAEEQNGGTKVPAVPVRRRRPITAQNTIPHLETGNTLGVRGRRVYGKRRRTFPQQQSTTVKTVSSYVEENGSRIGHQLDDDASSDIITTSQRPVSVMKRPTTSRASLVYGERVQTSTSSQQRKSSLQRENSNLEKNVNTNTRHLSNGDSNSEIRATTWRPASRFRVPTSTRSSITYGRRKETSSQRQSDSEKKESLNIEEHTSSKLESIDSRSRVSGVRRPTMNRASLVYGQQNQTSSQHHEHSMSQGSSEVEENISHNVQSITTDGAGLLIHNANADLLAASRIPVPARRRPAANRGDILYGQQQQTSLQQQSEFAKEESASVEENTFSGVQSNATDSKDTSLQYLVANRSPISTIGISTLNEGTLLHGQQQQTSSQQQSNSMTQESSEHEENTSSAVQSTITDTGAILDVDSQAAVVRRPTVSRSRGRTVHEQQQQTSSQQHSNSMTQQSSEHEENTTFDVQSIISNTEAMLDGDSQAAVVRSPTASRSRGRIVHEQQQQTSSQQHSNSMTQESSEHEENTSSAVQSTITNTGAILDVDSQAAVVGRPTVSRSRGRTVYEQQQQQTPSQQHSNSMTQESSEHEENTSSAVQSTITNTGAMLDVDSQAAVVGRPTVSRSRGRTVYEQQQQQTSSQQQSNSASEYSANVGDKISSNFENIDANDDESSEQHYVDTELRTIDRLPTPPIRIPTSDDGSIVHGQQQQTTSHQRSNSMTGEFSEHEENTFSDVRSTIDNSRAISDVHSQAAVIRRPTVSRGKTAYGQREKTASQQQSNSASENSTNIEEKTYSNDVSITTNDENLSEHDVNAELTSVDRRPISRSRIPALNVDSVVYGHEKQTSSQQQNHSVSQESSEVEENTSSSIESIGTNTENVSEHDTNTELPVTDRRPIPAIRIPTLNVNSMVRGQQQQTSSHQQSDFMTQESFEVEENTSSNFEDTISNTGNILEGNSEVAAIRRPTSSRGNVVYGEPAEIDFHQQIDSTHQESSELEENTSSDAQSFITNTGAQLYDHMTSHIIETTSFGNSASRHHADASSHEESGTIKHESSNSERSTSLNAHSVISSGVEPLSQGEADSQYLDTYGQQGEIVSTQERSETAVKESSSQAKEENTSFHVHHLTINEQTASNVQSNADIYGADQKQSLIINSETIPSTSINNRFVEQTESSTKQENEMNSSQATSSTKKSTTSTSNLSNLNTARQSLRGEVIFRPTETERMSSFLSNTNRKENGYVWHVANRTYVPVLINAGFLRDRPVTGIVGLDPVSQVSQSDVWDPNFIPELLPLTCDNMLFEERSQGSKILICDIPQSSQQPIRFLGDDKMTIFNGQILPAVMAPDRVQIRSESHEIRQPGSMSIGTDLLSSIANDYIRMQKTMKTNSMASESFTDESSRTTTVDETKNDPLKPIGNRFALKRPMLIIAEEIIVPSRPTQRENRGRIRYPNPRRQPISETDSIGISEEDEAEVNSSEFSKELLTTSSGSSAETRSSQESVSSSNSEQGITRSANLDVTDTDQYETGRKTEQRNSWFYTLPSDPTLSLPVEGIPGVTDEGELRNRKVVAVVDEAPATLTKDGKKTLGKFSSPKKQPLKELQVIAMRTSMDNGADAEEAEFVVPEDDFRLPTFFYNRDNRQARVFAPGVKRVTIPSEKLSMTGRINVIGPLPRGYKDPVLFPEKQLAIDLPVNSRDTDTFNSRGTYGKEINSRSTDYSFKASPVDPINWQ